MMSFAIAMLSTKMEFFFPALSRALEYFGGVPEVSKTDNMLQWVKRYDRYEPALNEAAEKWAMHYGTDIEGCRSRKPRDKGPAEGLVAKVYQFYYSRIYNETWTSLGELNNRIFELNDLYNNRIKSGLTYSRYDKFVKEAQPIMSNYSSVSGQRISLLKSIHSQRKTLPGRIKNGCWTLPCMILPVSAGSIWDWHMKSKLWILLSSCNMFRNTLIVS